MALTYIEHLPILVSAFTGWVSIKDFDSLVGIPIGIMSFAVGLKICAITAANKKYKKIIKNNKKKQDKTALLAKTKLTSTEVLTSIALID